jgi:Leucine-rich repeat (LRR) protein
MLTDLQNLVLGSNKLKSTFPESLFELTALKVVDLNANSISGTLPSTFAEATSLEILNLGSNALRGPMSIDHLVRSIFCPLKKVILTRNTFSGTFPLNSIAANCTATTSINLDSSGLVIEGGIPLTGLERLTILDLTSTELSGSIPDEISRFKFLQHFRMGDNALNGTIPESLGELTKLTWLSLARNSLEGLVPTTLGQLQQLTALDLRANFFSGSIPSELAGCTSLVNVNVEMNSLTGDIDYLCPLSLEELVSDCGGGNVLCSCCTQCY